MSGKKNKNQGAMALIYIRYLLPVVLCVLLIGAMFIPCLQYSTVEGTQSEISTAELLGNSWDQVREYLFATEEADRSATQERFSRTVLILIPILVLMYVIGLFSAVAVAIGGLIYINDREFRKTDARIWFVTLLPNRIVVCVLQAFILPLLFYSRLIIPLYDRIMHVDVLLNVHFPEAWVFGLISYAVIVALTAVSARFERRLDADPFKKLPRRVVRVVDRDDGEEAEKEKEPKFATEADRLYYENQRRAREEQAELIRKLLNKDGDDEDK